ncbi:MAG: hypothetical protein WDA27_03750 [Actinomycetota bacterium]
MRRLRQERGVSAVIVMVSMVALFGAAMLSVDAGSLWKTRRALITDTDAAALAAARYIDAGGSEGCSEAVAGGSSSGAGAEAGYVLGQNDAGASMSRFEVSPYAGTCTGDAGHVRVDATLPVPLAVAGLFGFKDISAFSSSAAQWGPLAAASGIRPVAVCDKSAHYLEWAAHLAGNDARWGTGPGHPGGSGGVVHRIAFERGSSGCGDASGNWDWLDFNDNAPPNGNSALSDWLRDGYPGVVSLGDAATGLPRDCNADQSGNQESCGPKTGAGGGSFVGSLQYLRDTRTTFPIAVYDRVVDDRDPRGCAAPPPWTASGSNARFCPVAFLLVRIHGWSNITGQLQDNSYIDLEFLDEWWVGQVGANPSESRPTVHGVQLCGGNYGATIDQRCDL